MRVLVAHNAYKLRGGEDAVVDSEVAMLRNHGHEVELALRHNDELDATPRLRAAAQTLWSRRTTAEIGAQIRRFKPDVLHVHNTFPLISPSVYWVAARLGVPVVQTLHNFRLLCPQAMLLREGRVCEDCVGGFPWRGVTRGCYRDSKAQSAVLASMLGVHRTLGTWSNKVTRYIALNEFCRSKFIAGGLPSARIDIKPNFVDVPRLPDQPRQGMLFVGRLSHEKGINVLAAAASVTPEISLEVAGQGPDGAPLAALPQAQMLGGLTPDQVLQAMATAQALIMPSIWYENFPRTLVEAFACGTPVIASRLGAMAELIVDGQTGLLFEPGDPLDLAAKLRWAASHPAEMSRMGRAARQVYEREYTADSNHEQLMTIYARACDEQSHRKASLEVNHP